MTRLILLIACLPFLSRGQTPTNATVQVATNYVDFFTVQNWDGRWFYLSRGYEVTNTFIVSTNQYGVTVTTMFSVHPGPVFEDFRLRPVYGPPRVDVPILTPDVFLFQQTNDYPHPPIPPFPSLFASRPSGAVVALHTNRVENMHAAGKSKTVTEVVYRVTTLSNSVALQTNSTDFIETEVAVPYPPSFAVSNRLTLKVWRPLPKSLVRPPRDPLNVRDK